MTADQTDRASVTRRDEQGDVGVALDLVRPVDLTVSNPNGEVRIRAADRDDAVVRYVKHGQPGSRWYAEAELLVASTANRIDVRVQIPGDAPRGAIGVNVDLGEMNPFKGRTLRAERGLGRALAEAREVIADVGRSFGGDGVRYDLEIELPRSVACRVVVRTASGDVLVEEIAGPTSVTTASGDARLRGVRGALSAQTASGDLYLETAHGRLTARTASGDIRLDDGALDGFDVQTASGDLTVGAALIGDGPFRAKTVSGDVRLGIALPDGSRPDLALALNTVSGDATVGPPFAQIDRRSWRLGPGSGARVSVQTVSGDLHAFVVGDPEASPPRSGPATPEAIAPPPTPPEPPTPPDRPIPAASAVDAPDRVETVEVAEAAEAEPTPPSRTGDPARLAVLEAVERGEIDVEEALRRLDPSPDQGA